MFIKREDISRSTHINIYFLIYVNIVEISVANDVVVSAKLILHSKLDLMNFHLT